MQRIIPQPDREIPLQVQIGYRKRLPADYQGERQAVTVSQHAADGGRTRYEFEERPGGPHIRG